jgi:beta-glucosidase
MKTWFAFLLIALQVGAAPLQAPAFAQSAAASSAKAQAQAHGQPNAKAHAQLPGVAKRPVLIALQAPADQKMDSFVSSLLNKMTLEEKIGQLNLLSVGADVTGPVLSQGVEEKISNGLVGGVFNIYGPSAVRKLQEMVMQKSRLKIPLIFGYDVIHGHRTIFPIPLGLASSWDMPLIERTAAAAASEASADGLNWTFSPMVDIARDPRWGRCAEGAGEDAFLGSKVAKAMVHGYQGESYAGAKTVMACLKHFALYGAAEAGRDYNTVDMSRLRMYNEYLPPYKAAVDANVGSVMTSFNEIDGIPATGNKWLLTDLLRKQWGFKGFVCTDYTAVSEMIDHGMGDEQKVAELALNAGVDMDMVSELFIKHGSALFKSGRVSQAQIDAACRRILEAKYKLGLFDDPYRYISEERNKKELMSSEKLALSKEAALKSMVLLKNDNQVLPLNAQKKIAFIGPLVKDQRNLIGCWSGAGQGKDAVSIWQALETKFGADKFLYAKGCDLVADQAILAKLNREGAELATDQKSPQTMIADAVETAKQADTVVAVLGEPLGMSGEAASRSSIGLLDNQIDLLKALKATGKPIVLVLMNGRPLTLSWEDKNLDAILETWFGGTRTGPAITDILFGDANPSGKITMTFPRNVGQIPIYYGAKNTGRPFAEAEKYKSKYLDVSNSPLYPFGYGLSYTTFKYGNVVLSGATLNSIDKGSSAPNTSLQVSTTVTNSGKCAGVEIVQLYVHDKVGSITRPVKELKGFQRVELKPDETKTVSFTLTSDDLRFYNSDLKYQAEPGDFKVFIGSNSRDVKDADFKLFP